MRRASSVGTRALQWAFVIVMSAAPLRAAASELSLVWDAPQECPDRAQLATRVSRLLGGAVPSQLSASARVTRTEQAYRASVRISGPGGVGERDLENPQCDLLAESVALVIALSATSADTPPLPDRSSAPTERPSFGVSAQASALFGVLPNPALGIGAGLSMDASHALRFELRGSYYAKQSVTFDQGSPGGRFNLVTFAARGCHTWRLGTFDLAPCLGADLYHVIASGFGGELSLNQAATWWGPALALFGRWRVHEAFAIAVSADAVVPITRRRFVYADVGELHRAAAVAVQLMLAPEVRF